MKTLAIYLNGSEYARRLSGYLRANLHKKFNLITYSKKDLLMKAISEGKISILVIQEGDIAIDEDDSAAITSRIDRLIVLSNDREESGINEYEKIYKYLPASDIAERIDEKAYSELSCHNQHDRAVIFTFCSPIGGIGTTSLAIACAKYEGQTKDVLYLNLNAFTDITEELFLDERKTLSEALYCFASGDKDTTAIAKYIQKADGFDTFASVRSYKELSKIGEDVIIEFIHSISENLNYRLIIIDCSVVVSGFLDLLGTSDRIIITYKEGYIFKKKRELFIKELHNELSEAVIDKIKYINIPFYNNQPDSYDQLESSPVGRLVRSIYENDG